ncbi:hypothetical protein [Heyndrickxia oleronia]|uniref:hypothetical protein n=1 Tax=Heyndrickxia oleronia TaxID=38875 RepID=UPI001B1697A9|nr:hypothetical protein [Heyndrickxia oleronia]GIN40173.1 hypothetical protein J19TS1_31220 [Heyndrickxia oleronia]
METNNGGRTATMCVRSVSGNTLRRENSNNVRPRTKWRHMTKEKQQQCVSESEVETHDEGKTATMCVRSASGDT